jgi:hypothetical protein
LMNGRPASTEDGFEIFLRVRVAKAPLCNAASVSPTQYLSRHSQDGQRKGRLPGLMGTPATAKRTIHPLVNRAEPA